jgi:beta-lactam-binding protein with PASTA domain
MGVERDYTGDDVYLLKQTTEIPDLAGMTYLEARSALGALQITGVASGGKVLDSTRIQSQMPAPGTRLHKNATVVLYASEQVPEDLVPIPDFRGMSVGEASRYASQCGLNILIQGDCLGLVITQEPASPGSEATEEPEELTGPPAAGGGD